jgi:hypothetical protein
MKLLDQFIKQTGKQPVEWTSLDIQKYLNYVKAELTEVVKPCSESRPAASGYGLCDLK